MEGLSKVAIACVTGAAVLVVVVLLYNATVMNALGMMGNGRPLSQIEKGRVIYAPFTTKSVSGIMP